MRFQPTLPARGATGRRRQKVVGCVDFNPRSPHGERRPWCSALGDNGLLFQPTLPARGATTGRMPESAPARDFNPRSPHGERRKLVKRGCFRFDFNPRSPHGERPRGRLLIRRRSGISTHAPRTGSDARPACRSRRGSDFNPRSPHGERLRSAFTVASLVIFQPTLPARGATVNAYVGRVIISNFNPRSPHGERRHLLAHRGQTVQISTHAPRTGSDARSATVSGCCRTFQPTLPARGATWHCWSAARAFSYFNPRSPHGERLKVGRKPD